MVALLRESNFSVSTCPRHLLSLPTRHNLSVTDIRGIISTFDNSDVQQ